jgi:hypothetical protein
VRSDKFQISNPKFQLPGPDQALIPNFGIIGIWDFIIWNFFPLGFGILRFGICVSFGILDLIFGILN